MFLQTSFPIVPRVFPRKRSSRGDCVLREAFLPRALEVPETTTTQSSEKFSRVTAVTFLLEMTSTHF
jgi:hypothetical protein